MIKKCKICSQEFQTRPSHVKMGWGKFCSNKCHYLSMKTGKFVECDECKIKIYKNNTKLGRSKSGKYFCGKSCQTKWRNKFFSGNKHLNWINGENTYRNLLLRADIKQICSRCKKDDTRILAVHHIDRNRKNNTIENLVWLCHNCHYLVHHDTVEGQKFLK